MENYLLMEKNAEGAALSKKLGFSNTFFLSDVVFLQSEDKKTLLRQIQKAKGKKIIFEPKTMEMARFAVERTNVDVIVGVEKIHPKDSVHYVRSGLNQVICKFAAANGKVVAFSFADVLHARDRGKIISRMKTNVALCRKYGVKTVLSSFALSISDMRSARDLTAFWRVLQKTRK